MMVFVVFVLLCLVLVVAVVGFVFRPIFVVEILLVANFFRVIFSFFEGEGFTFARLLEIYTLLALTATYFKKFSL